MFDVTFIAIVIQARVEISLTRAKAPQFLKLINTEILFTNTGAGNERTEKEKETIRLDPTSCLVKRGSLNHLNRRRVRVCAQDDLRPPRTCMYVPIFENIVCWLVVNTKYLAKNELVPRNHVVVACELYPTSKASSS